MQPVRDPSGTLESLNAAALALLCAFTGAAVGVALSGVLLTPFYRLAHGIWRRSMQRGNAGTFSKKEAEEPRPFFNFERRVVMASSERNDPPDRIGEWL